MKRMLWLVLLIALSAVKAPAIGIIIVHDQDFWDKPHVHPPRPAPPPFHPDRRIRPPQPAWAPLELSSTRVTATIRDQVAETIVDQEFYNPNARQLEGTFLFPVPKGAHLSRFAMEINGKQVEAELLAADKARGLYEEIVRKLQDPALLEYGEGDVFKVRIFPIEAHAKKRISLSYHQVLVADNGLAQYSLPLSTGKYSSKPIKQLSIKVDLQTKRPLKTVYSPSHSVEVKRHGDYKATAGFETTDAKPEADFQLYFHQEEAEFGLTFLAHKPGAEDGFFLLLASPGAEDPAQKPQPKDIVFVVDTSGSMAGAKLEQAKKALLFCVENLGDQDRFEIIRFATETEPLFNDLAAVDAERKTRAREFVRGLKPIGGTAIDDALRKALSLRPTKADRPYMVIFLTDGRPTVGTTDENQIVAGVTRDRADTTRVFCFGIGSDVNTHMLDRITEKTHAFSQYVLAEEDLEIKVSNFYTKIKEPVLGAPKLTFPDSIRVTKIYPAPLPDLFKGQQLVVSGRFSGHGSGKVKVEGLVNGQSRSFSYSVDIPERSQEHGFIPRLWATRRIGYLLDEIRLRGENNELKDEVSELARQYGVVTPYTAYLILEDERRRDIPTARRSFEFLERDTLLRQEAAANYRELSSDKTGDKALAGARSYYKLKTADASAEGISGGNAEALRVLTQPSAPQRSRSTFSPDAKNAPAAAGATAPEPYRDPYSQNSRFIAGRTFYQNNEKWIDALAQTKRDGRRVKIQFDSPEYFQLLTQHAAARPWLSLGKNVEFVLDDTIYEIHE